MKKVLEKIDNIQKKILYEEKKELSKYFITEMKKIGIEKLPYSYSSLKKFIDSETMDFHYNKHYKGYVKKLNSALSKKDYGDLELDQIVMSISRFDKTIRNNAGGAFNHAMFWKMLSPKTQTPNGNILKKIKQDFGTFQNFKSKFEEEAKSKFGSGWTWLVLTKSGKLKIMSTSNQDNPLMNDVKGGGFPLLGLDLWEHAYYLKYRNKRDEYIKNFWLCVNWTFVEDLFNLKVKRKMNENFVLKQLVIESKIEGCSRELSNQYRVVFNINPKVRYLFKDGIDEILKQVFSKNYFKDDEYEKGMLKGIYDLEGKGRSLINKLNTNYSCFCILLTDVNKVLRSESKPEIKILGLKPSEQIEETKKFIEILDEYKKRIFSEKSQTFSKIMNTLSSTNSQGEKKENYVVDVLKKKFGDENVVKVGKLGSSEDMVEGVDCTIKIDGIIHEAQIKPYGSMNEKDEMIYVNGVSGMKKYKTDLMIFSKSRGKVYIFNNSNTKIEGDSFVFKKSDLIYSL